MNKKVKILIGLGLIAAAGITGVIIWKKRKNAVEAEVVADETTTSGTTASASKSSNTGVSPASTVTSPSGVTKPAATTTKTGLTSAMKGVAYKFTSVQQESATNPYAKFILEKPMTGVAVGTKINVTSPLYKGTATVSYVWNNQHLFTKNPFKGTDAGTLTLG